MEIRYQNARIDFETLAEWMWRDRKIHQRNSYYYYVAWYMGIIALATGVSVKADEIFMQCVFIVLGVMYLWKNWSFEKYWRQYVKEYGDLSIEYTATLKIDDAGLTESFMGLSIHVPWTQLREYADFKNRLLVSFLKARTFVIPIGDLRPEDYAQLISVLKEHGIRESK